MQDTAHHTRKWKKSEVEEIKNKTGKLEGRGFKSRW
jgi:hypothetical protein